MPRTQMNDGQEILFADLNATPARTERELYERVIFEMMQRTVNAFFGPSFLVTRTSSTAISIAAGSGFQQDNTQADPEATIRPLYLPAAVPLSITTPDGSHDRIDIVCVKHGRATTLTQNRNFKDATSGAISVQALVMETDWLAATQIVAGTPGVTPAAPATPSGYSVIAQLYVTTSTGIAATGAVTDKRTLFKTTGLYSLAAIDWFPAEGIAGVSPPLQTEVNGARVYKFGAASTSNLVQWIKVPKSYVAGNPINLHIMFADTVDITGTALFQTTAYLVCTGIDARTVTTNSRVSTNATVNLATVGIANVQNRVVCDLTDGVGAINGVAVSPGDTIRVILTRATDTAVNDLDFIPSMSEVTYQ
jgi:hypothetical protein